LAAASVLRERGPVADGVALLSSVIEASPADVGTPLLIERAALRVRAGALTAAEDDLRSAAPPAADWAGELALALGDLHRARESWEAAIGAYEDALTALQTAGRPTGPALLGLGRTHMILRRSERAAPLLVQ